MTIQNGAELGTKTAYAVAVSAIAASCFVAFPSLSPQVGASAGAKGDRTDIRPLGTECGEKARGRISTPPARAMRAFRPHSRVTSG